MASIWRAAWRARYRYRQQRCTYGAYPCAPRAESAGQPVHEPVRRSRLRIVVEILESVAERVAVVTDVFRLPSPLGCFESVVAPLLVLLLIHRPHCVLSLSLALLALLLARPDRDCLPPPEHV